MPKAEHVWVVMYEWGTEHGQPPHTVQRKCTACKVIELVMRGDGNTEPLDTECENPF